MIISCVILEPSLPRSACQADSESDVRTDASVLLVPQPHCDQFCPSQRGSSRSGASVGMGWKAVHAALVFSIAGDMMSGLTEISCNALGYPGCVQGGIGNTFHDSCNNCRAERERGRDGPTTVGHGKGRELTRERMWSRSRNSKGP
jgi:hypothetical protein